MINWERNRQQANDARTKHDIDVLAYRLKRMDRDDDDWERTFDMLRDRINRYQYSTQRDVDPEQLAAITNIQYQPRRKKSDFVPVDESNSNPYDFIKPGAMVKFGMWNKPQEHRTGQVVKMADGVVTVATDDGKNINLILANKSLSVYPVSADRQGVAEGSSCNMTLEGEYCPEHGLMECGMHEGAFHNPDQQPSPVAQAITRRILLQRTDLLSKYGPEKVGQAIDEVADFVGDVEEIGSSDVSGWVRHVEQMLGNMGDDVGEGVDDPINYNGAITGSYYESKQDPLARIKSLALRK
jgi:hypothetical protein